jgi:hypothetical protein
MYQKDSDTTNVRTLPVVIGKECGKFSFSRGEIRGDEKGKLS